MIVTVHATAECPIHGLTWVEWDPTGLVYICLYGTSLTKRTLRTVREDLRCQYAGDPRQRARVFVQ